MGNSDKKETQERISQEKNSQSISLAELGIPWKGSPRQWSSIPHSILPYCTVQGKVYDCSGLELFTLKPIEPLGGGTFGIVDAFSCIEADKTSIVAIKRPKHQNIHLLHEALFQWKLYNDLKPYGLSFCVPKVYRIFRFKATGDVWFSMKRYESQLLSTWCSKKIGADGHIFALLLLQIALVLEVVQDILRIDHRDLKVNNILVVDTPTSIGIDWEGKETTIDFPFHIVLLDFGFACKGGVIDIRADDGLPPIDFCPKEGRDIFQILVSLWRIPSLRSMLDVSWGGWIRSRIGRYVSLTESAHDLNWMYSVTDDTAFSAPDCAPSSIIRECMKFLEGRS